MARCFVVALASALLGSWPAASDELPPSAKVKTSGGEVFGTTLPANSGGEAVDQFLGIPFAHAERFQPPDDFKGKYAGGAVNALKWGPACLQVGTPPEAAYGSEDCLKANVWRPRSATAGSDLPVMVFIYGGSNQFGEAEPYNMSGLAAFHEVVCVSFNYRTGPLGWMAFQEDVEAKRSTGNWGILDIQSALRWVQREIAAFGGDACRVAIHGQSSGAGLVELQYVAPASRGLFRGAVSESGDLSAMSLQTALESATMVAKTVDCLTKDGKVNKTCVAAASAATIVGSTYTGSWGPSTDGVTFPKDPMELLEHKMVNDATIVLGAQTNDTNLFLFRSFTQGGLDQPNDHPDGALKPLPPVLYRGMVVGMVGLRLVDKALKLYPANVEDYKMNVHQVGNMQSDKQHCASRKRASLINAALPGRAFTYRFDYWYQSNPGCSAVPNYHLPYLGAAHQDEVTFVLGQPNFMEDGSCCGVWGLTTSDCPHLPRCQACYAPTRFKHDGYRAYFDDREWNFTRTVGAFWTNVAASGDPNCRQSSKPETCSNAWPKFEKGEHVTSNIVLSAELSGGAQAEVTPYNRPEICEFWDEVAMEPLRSDGNTAAAEELFV